MLQGYDPFPLRNNGPFFSRFHLIFWKICIVTHTPRRTQYPVLPLSQYILNAIQCRILAKVKSEKPKRYSYFSEILRVFILRPSSKTVSRTA